MGRSNLKGVINIQNGEEILKAYLEELRSEQLYFNGINVIKYIDTAALSRFQKWFQRGFCLETSVLAMILLKNNPTATLCRGKMSSMDEDDEDNLHAWVEFKYFGLDCIFDLSWYADGITLISHKREEPAENQFYYYRANDDDAEIEMVGADLLLYKKWSISHDEFWTYLAANQIYEVMKKPETSYVFNELHQFIPVAPDYDFAIGPDDGIKTSCKFMVPFYLYGKIMASEIMDYFVKHPDATEPDIVLLKALEPVIAKFGARAKELQFDSIDPLPMLIRL